MKGTFGRIPRSPRAWMRPNTVVLGNLARSVRDAARYFDVCAGFHPWDPTSLPSAGGWEAGLGTHELRGLRVAVVPALGGARLEPGVEERIRTEAAELIKSTGMVEVDLKVEPPNLAAEWMLGNLATLLAELGPLWPGCAGELTVELALGLAVSEALYNLHTAAAAEEIRIRANEAMGAAFDEVDLVIAATNPGPAFPAQATTSSEQHRFVDWLKSAGAARWALRGLALGVRVASAPVPRLPGALISWAVPKLPDLVTMGALTIISNVYGNPAVSIPAGTIDGLPIGMQVLARHHEDALLFDVALAVERERPWPLVAPTVRASEAAAV
jgi:aspartyl-tRNA(Asn)/glutamyl-tRNA(Gln) amidotransferase subunit A